MRMGFGYPEGLRFECVRCALCCGDTRSRKRCILLLQEDARSISEAVFKPIEAFATKTRGHGLYVYKMRKTREGGKCVFLEGTDCSIYPKRPLVCRFYPFELVTQKDRKPSFFCTGECPGVKRGRRLEREYFEDLFNLACEQLADGRRSLKRRLS